MVAGSTAQDICWRSAMAYHAVTGGSRLLKGDGEECGADPLCICTEEGKLNSYPDHEGSI